jgi:hypothetical protein
MTAPKPTAEKWNPRLETYDAFCDRGLREMVEAYLDQPDVVARLAAGRAPTPDPAHGKRATA